MGGMFVQSSHHLTMVEEGLPENQRLIIWLVVYLPPLKIDGYQWMLAMNPNLGVHELGYDMTLGYPWSWLVTGMVDGVFNHINPITFPAVRPHCMGNSTCKGGVSLTGVIGAQKHQSWLNNGSLDMTTIWP